MSLKPNTISHTPVLTKEIIELFKPHAGDTLLDATIGTGGHTETFLKASSSPESTVIGIDADAQALELARQRLAEYGNRVAYISANFANLKDSLLGGGILASEASNPAEALRQARGSNKPPMFTHILFDLGVGSHQLADPKRGFSFRSAAPLTMCYGDLTSLPASQIAAINVLTNRLGYYPDVIDLIRGLKERELAQTIRFYSEERHAARIANAIKKDQSALTTAQTLSDTIKRASPRRKQPKHSSKQSKRPRSIRLHPATRTFQALRLAVNRELEALTVALPQAVALLKDNGVVVVISFHSLEDRIVKHFFRSQKETGTLRILTKKPIRASQDEVTKNIRARSAKLRAAQKIP